MGKSCAILPMCLPPHIHTYHAHEQHTGTVRHRIGGEAHCFRATVPVSFLYPVWVELPGVDLRTHSLGCINTSAKQSHILVCSCTSTSNSQAACAPPLVPTVQLIVARYTGNTSNGNGTVVMQQGRMVEFGVLPTSSLGAESGAEEYKEPTN